MNQLEIARVEINEIDEKMAILFEKRMVAVKSIVRYKSNHGLPVFDANREQQVLDQNCSLIQDHELLPYFNEYLLFQMKLSKKYQEYLLVNWEVF